MSDGKAAAATIRLPATFVGWLAGPGVFLSGEDP